MPWKDKRTAMWCPVVLAGVLRECQVWTSVYSLWLGFCFFQVTTHTHLVSTHQQQLLQKDFFKFLDTPVTLECKLWMYLKLFISGWPLSSSQIQQYLSSKEWKLFIGLPEGWGYPFLKNCHFLLDFCILNFKYFSISNLAKNSDDGLWFIINTRQYSDSG